MPFLTVAGIEVLVTEWRELATERVGSQRRAFNGSLRTAFRAQRRAWRFTGLRMDPVDYEALRTATALGQHVTCSGDGLPGSVTASVEIEDATAVRDGTGHQWIPSATIREV